MPELVREIEYLKERIPLFLLGRYVRVAQIYTKDGTVLPLRREEGPQGLAILRSVQEGAVLLETMSGGLARKQGSLQDFCSNIAKRHHSTGWTG